MSFLSGIAHAIGNFFGGGDNEEEKRRKQQQQQQQQANNQAPQQRPSLNVLGQQTRTNDINDLLDPKKALNAGSNPGIQLIQSGNQAPKAPAQPDPEQQKQAELKRLEDEAYKKAKAQRSQGENIWSRNVGIGWLGGNKNAIEDDARMLAKSQAAKNYLEIHGYDKNQDPAIKQLQSDARAIGDENSARLQQDAHVLNNVQKGATKVAQVAQYVPVTGTVLNLGLAGAERANVGGMKNEIADQRYQNEFGMTKEQFDALDPSVQAKLHNIRNVGYALSPLDFTGLAGFGKSEAVSAGKNALVKGVQHEALTLAEKDALKMAGKQLLKRTALNTAVAAGGQQYLNGKIDPLEALKTGTLLTGTGELFNPVNLEKSAKAPGMKSVNPNLVEDAKQQIADQAAQASATVAKTQVDPRTGKPVAEPDLNTPAYQRKAEAAAAAPQIAKERAAAEQALVPDTPMDTVPSYQHKQNIQDVIDTADNELNDWVNANPNHTPQQLEAAKQSLRQQAVEKITALKDERAGRPQAVENPQAPATEAKSAVNPQEATPPVAAVPTPSAAVEAVPTSPRAVDMSPEGQRARFGLAYTEVRDYTHEFIDAVDNGDFEKASSIRNRMLELATPNNGELQGRVQALDKYAASKQSTPDLAQGAMPNIPENAPGAQQVPVAPRTREAALAHLGELAKEIPGDGKMRDVTNLDDLAQSARGAIEQLSPEELVGTFGSDQIKGIQTDAKGFAILRAGRDKLSEMLRADPQNGDIKEALATTLDEMANRASNNGLLMRVVQEEFDAMPIEAKVRYLIKKIDGANQNVEGYESLRRDPAKLQLVENELNYRLTQSQTKADELASYTALAQHAADAARQGEKVDLKGLAKEVANANTELQRLNGELVKYFETLVPKRSLGNRALVDTPKRLMLLSATGRINDVLTTGFNVLEQQTTGLTQGLIAKGVNAVGRLTGHPGVVTDTSKGILKLPGGAWQGLKKTVGEIRGNQYTENLERSLKGNEDLRSGLPHSRGKLSRTIQASTEMATNLTEGTKTQRLLQLADQEAKKLGLKGEMRKQYTEARTIAPSRQMLEAADKLKMEMNNLNENPVSRKLTQVSASIGGNTVVGGIIKNQILPFTSWLGGNIYNSITDKNVIASSIKFANALRKGDPEAATRNLARTINGTVQAYALGYQLTKQGILTDSNAEGYSTDGPFVHVGDRYIPVKFFGFFAPNIVLGNAAYAATEGNTDGESPAKVVADKIGNYAWHSLAFGQALGAENTVARATDAMNRPGGSKADAAATAAGGVVGQFIPGISGDISSLLDNGVNIGGKQIISDQLNPTHEAPETRVGKTGLTPTGRESKAKDVPASVVAGLQSRIPVASQMLPRKEGVAAKDLFDRTVRGDRDTSTSINNRQVAKQEKDQAADWKKRDIPNYKEPDFDTKVQARFESGEYDKAIEAAQAKYDADSKNKDVPKSKLKDQEDKIKLYKVHKDGKFDPEMVQKYKSLSVTEWRNLGDPESDTYNPMLYQKFYDYDSALAKAGISGSSLDPSANKYTQKKSGSGGRGGRGGKSPAIGNTLGSIEQLKRVDLSGFKLEKTPSGGKIPTVATVKPGELIKKRQISVRSGR